jgi:hypothetical protein
VKAISALRAEGPASAVDHVRQGGVILGAGLVLVGSVSSFRLTAFIMMFRPIVALKPCAVRRTASRLRGLTATLVRKRGIDAFDAPLCHAAHGICLVSRSLAGAMSSAIASTCM